MDLKIKDNSQLKLAPFTQLEYIESTGTQYIQTNFSLNLSNKIHCKVKENINNSNGGVPFAATWEQNKMFYLQYGNNITFCYYGSSYAMNSVDTNVHEFTLNDNGKYYIDGVEKGTVTQQNINIQNFRIFDIYVPNSSTNFKFTGRIYFIEIYDGVTLLHNFIPVKDNNEVVCMYDTVSETFFYNQGTGNFVAGPVINPGLPENIILKTTTLYHKNTPNIDGLQLLNGILNTQEVAEDVILNRIRVDIGNAGGSLSELLRYASMSGFNDSYEPQTKPRLVGTWTINDWYTTAQLAQAQQAFDGLTIIGDPNYIIDFNQMAVQVLDNTQPNYNPAVAIILQAAGLGVTFNTPVIDGQTGRWMLTKAQAATITSVGDLFNSKTIVTDTNGIVSSNTSATYDFDKFNEFIYFGVISGNNLFLNCSKLKELSIPSTITSLSGYCFSGINLNKLTLPDIDSGVSLSGSWMCWYNSSIGELYAYSTNQLQHTTIGTNDGRGVVPGKCYVNDVEITSFTLANDVTDIGMYHVYGASMNKIVCNDNITTVRVYAEIETVGLVGSGCDLELGNNTQYLALAGSRLTQITIPNSITSLGVGFLEYNRNNLTLEIPVGVTSIPDRFLDESNANVTFLGTVYFAGTWTTCYHHTGWLHFAQSTVVSLPGWGGDFSTPHIYVGDGSSASHDDAVLQAYLADTSWSSFTSRLDTWYNYLHPQA